MPATEVWEPVTRKRRLMSPASREAVGGRLMTLTPVVDGSTAFSVPQVLRSRSRTRRRRRKRSWAALWASLALFWRGPALFSAHPSFLCRDLRSPQRVFGAWANKRGRLMDPRFYRERLVRTEGLDDPTAALVAIIAIRIWSLHEAVKAACRLTRRSTQGRKPWHVRPELI